ncbi:pyridoxal-phosphate dependent enzyme [Kitasatospora arboriphila]
MAIISTADEIFDSDVYIDLRQPSASTSTSSARDSTSPSSVKLRAAVSMVSAGMHQGFIGRGSTLIESSSGNLGVALSVVAAANSLRFVCVTDPKCNPSALKLMRAYGSEVVVVDRPDAGGNYLTARKAKVQELCARNSDWVWLNQYENPANWLAHYENTAPLIAKQFPGLDVLFVGAGTGGTLSGCVRYFRENHPDVRIVAIDSVGSVNFGMPPGSRHIPGLGASEPMPLITPDLATDVVRVREADTVRMCRSLAARGFLLGGSTGTVVSGAREWLRRNDPGQCLTAVAISADLGERYIDTVYDDTWTTDHYGDTGWESGNSHG